jgi:hypothetical protein
VQISSVNCTHCWGGARPEVLDRLNAERPEVFFLEWSLIMLRTLRNLELDAFDQTEATSTLEAFRWP